VVEADHHQGGFHDALPRYRATRELRGILSTNYGWRDFVRFR
jgi:hypothetical protein